MMPLPWRKNLGTVLHTVPIESAMSSYDQMLAQEFKGCKQDVTEENLQARIRGAILMALSASLAIWR